MKNQDIPIQSKYRKWIKRIFLAIFSILVLFSFCTVLDGHHSNTLNKNREIVDTENIHQDGISPIALTTMPFILAIKHLIVNREE